MNSAPPRSTAHDSSASSRRAIAPLALVIFDCDGVLIDSEALCNRVVALALTREGWPLTTEACQRRFVGLTFADIQTAAESHLGRPLGPDWTRCLVERVAAVMAVEAELVPGAREALEAVAGLGLPYRIASNSSREEMAAKFARTGLLALTEGRIHSAHDLIARGKNGKPDPDLFLEAAEAEQVDPAACVVIEDSLAGVRAAVAAGMTCLAYCPDGAGEKQRQAGAVPFASMFALPDTLRTLMTGPA